MPATSLSTPDRPRREFRPAHLTLLTDRIWAAAAAGVIDIHDDWEPTATVAITGGEVMRLLAVLLPEAFAERPAPPSPAASPPGSPGRVEEYAARQAAGVGLYHPADPTLEAGAVVVRKRNNGGANSPKPKSGETPWWANRPADDGLQVVDWTEAVKKVMAAALKAARRRKR